jgi:hypothetical protein
VIASRVAARQSRDARGQPSESSDDAPSRDAQFRREGQYGRSIRVWPVPVSIPHLSFAISYCSNSNSFKTYTRRSHVQLTHDSYLHGVHRRPLYRAAVTMCRSPPSAGPAWLTRSRRAVIVTVARRFPLGLCPRHFPNLSSGINRLQVLRQATRMARQSSKGRWRRPLLRRPIPESEGVNDMLNEDDLPLVTDILRPQRVCLQPELIDLTLDSSGEVSIGKSD